VSLFTLTYEADARNTSTATLAAAALAAAGAVDPNVPVTLLSLTPGLITTIIPDSWRVQVALTYTGTNTPDCVPALTNLYTAELARSLATQVRPLPVTVV
jgi:hypothetical protein